MKYLPFEHITYKTTLEPQEVLKRLTEVVEPKKTFRMTGLTGKSNNKPYEGYVEGQSFNITRIIGYRNSFLPRIKGIVEKSANGTTVKVSMKLHIAVIIFMLIWLGGVGVGCSVILLTAFESQSFEPMKLIPFGMLIFGYALTTGGFKYESVKSKKYLADLFNAKMED